MTMKEPLVPRRIRVGNKWLSVEIVETMRRKADVGRILYDDNRIEIAKRSGLTGRSFRPNDMGETFWHELVHAILRDMKEDELNDNETFVEGFAQRLYKAIKSARF